MVFKESRRSIGREIAVKPDAELHHEQFDLMAVGWLVVSGWWLVVGG